MNMIVILYLNFSIRTVNEDNAIEIKEDILPLVDKLRTRKIEEQKEKIIEINNSELSNLIILSTDRADNHNSWLEGLALHNIDQIMICIYNYGMNLVKNLVNMKKDIVKSVKTLTTKEDGLGLGSIYYFAWDNYDLYKEVVKLVFKLILMVVLKVV